MKRIAVVEDNPDNMLLVSVLLEDFYEIEQFGDGIEALEKMPNSIPDLVLLDISLPGIDGMEVLARMKQSEVLRSVPVIALTAHAGQADREKFITAGFDDYVTKPIVDETLLLSAISRLLGEERAA